MDATTWSRVQHVLGTVIDLPESQRAARLDDLCGDDASLRREVESLLACEGELTEQLPDAVWKVLADESLEQSHIGERIGPFEIETCLGEGGSSVVYAARRVNDFSQRVAIKLLRHHVGASVARRFGLEREMLSRLSHPHIAKLFDAGTLADATPYLVLELVQGCSWQEWLNRDQPSLRERILKFLEVCDAISHAHQHLLVHRDIKPSNLMIDADGRAMLLDFGIAKLLDDTELSTLTRDGGFALTPAYAAPEQLRGEPVTTATDVYALGIVLYETLTGHRPFATAAGVSLRVTAHDAALPPLRPSQQPHIPGHVVPKHALRGDLDNIVMMALEVEPGRRHASVTALAADLRAWLSGLPVAARARSFSYVAGKFIKRHPFAIAAAGAAVLAIAAALLVALQETQRARRHLAEARTLAHDILTEYPEQIANLPGSLPVQERMVRDAMRYLDSLREVAGADAALSYELASGYLRIGDIQGNPYRANLGDLAGAEASYREAALALSQWRRLAPDAPGMALLQARLASRVAALDHQQSRLEAGAQGFRSALAGFAALPAAERDAATLLEHAAALDFYGDLLGNSAQASLLDTRAGAESHAAARELLAEALRQFPGDPALQLGLATSIERDGDDALGARDLPRAAVAYRDAIQRIEAMLAADPGRFALRRELAGLHSRMAQVHELEGDADAAIGAAAQSVAMVESLLAADPTNDQLRQGAGAGLGILAKYLIRAGRFADAAPIVDRQIAVNQRRVDASPDNAEMLLALSLGFRRRGEQRAGLGDYAGAVQAHGQALELQSAIADQSADNESHRALTLLHLGRVERARGDTDAAILRLQQAIVAMDALVAAHADVPVYREDLIDAEEALGDTLANRPEAVPHYARAIALIDAGIANGALAPAFTERRVTLATKLAAAGRRR
jgi:tetratricopeptide (TPR) repeat protein